MPSRVEWILIDEVQRAPRLLDVTHRLIESTGKRFVLTGSSGQEAQAGASNLLGRPGLRVQPLSPDRTRARGCCPARRRASLGNAAVALLAGPGWRQAGVPESLRTDLSERRDRRRADREKARSVQAILEVAAQSNGAIVNYTTLHGTWEPIRRPSSPTSRFWKTPWWAFSCPHSTAP